MTPADRCSAPPSTDESGGVVEPGIAARMEPTDQPGDAFQLLFQRSRDPNFLMDPATGILIDANQTAADLLDAPGREHLLNRPLVDWAPEHQPDGRSSSEALLHFASRTERQIGLRFEWRIRSETGGELPVEIVATPIEVRGRTLHVLVARDLTERKRAEAAVRETESILASIADNISEAIYRSDAGHRLIFVNQAYLQMFGYPSLAELQSVPREVLYAEPPVRKRLLALLARDGQFNQQEVEYVRRDGRRFWGLASSRIIRDPETGAVAYHVGAITDITEHRRATEEIQRLYTTLERRIAERTAELTASEAQLRTLVEQAPEAIVVYDGDTGRFISGNENALCLFGLDRGQLLSVTPADVSPEKQPNGEISAVVAERWLREAMEGGIPVFDWTHRHSSGRLIPCEIRLVRLPVEGRCLIRGSVIDNTERHRRVRVQEAIYQISEAVYAAGDLDELYVRIHDIVRSLMPAENFYIALLDPLTNLIQFPYYRDEYDVRQEARPLDTGLTSYVLRTGQPLLVDAAMKARKKYVGSAVTFEGWEAITYVESGPQAAIWLGVPLKLQGKCFGVMALQDYHCSTVYGEEAKQILTFVAGQTALAIDRKRSEQALRESEQKFRALFEASSQGVMLHDTEGFLEVNPATLRILGLEKPQDILGRHPKDTAPPFQPDGRTSEAAARAYIEECMANGSARFDWISRRADGSDIPLEVILTRVQMAGRQIIQAVINDISERKRVEDELRTSEARLRETEARFSAAFRASPVITTLSRLSDGTFVEVNDAFLRWNGRPREEVIGRTAIELGLWADLSDRATLVEEMQGRKPIHGREVQLRTRAGEVHTILLSGEPVEINGEPHVLLAGLDITDRKRAEAEVLRTLEREKELGLLKSNFVSMVSHEFRTPLGIIMSSAGILQKYFARLTPDERNDHLESIQRSTRRMGDLMEEVLLLARLDAGRMGFEPVHLDFGALCRAVTDEVLSVTNRRCPIILDQEEMTHLALADENLLRQIFTNLLTNAVKYSEPGSQVDFTVRREGDSAICVVRDRGIGIPEQDRNWLFHAFHRGHNVGQRSGTGLGLVIVQRCLELHEGTIEVESSVGAGTVMTVRLPLFRGAAPVRPPQK